MEETYWVTGELVFRNYQPEKIEKGMLYINILYPKTDRQQFEIYALDHTPHNQEKFIMENGYPVQLFILDATTEELLAEPHEIHWMDFGEEADHLVQISLKEINIILNDYEGYLEIECAYDEEEELYIPILIEDYVVLRFVTDEEEDDE